MMFLVLLRRSGAEWDPARPMEEQSRWREHAAYMDELVEAGMIVLGGPLADEKRVAMAVSADSPVAVREALGLDPWSGSHLVVEAVDPWLIRLDAGGGPASFLVVRRRSGPQWQPSRPLEEQSGWPEHAAFMDALEGEGFIVLGGPLADDDRVAFAVHAESEPAVRATLARDAWSETHLVLDAVEPWTIRLDGRAAGSRTR